MPGFNWPADKRRDEDDRASVNTADVTDMLIAEGETLSLEEFLDRAQLVPGPPAVAQHQITLETDSGQLTADARHIEVRDASGKPVTYDEVERKFIR